MGPRALIFDFDGVMTDTDLAGEQVWRSLFGWYGSIAGVELFDQNIHAWTLPDVHHALTSVATRPIEGSAFEKEWSLVWSTLSWNNMPARPGALELLHAAKQRGWRIGVATNAQRWHVSRHLQAWGVAHAVDTIEAVSGTAMARKPAPDVYCSAAAALGVSPRDAVAVEDSDDGLRAALAAGMVAVGIRTRWRSASFPGARHVVDTFIELAPKLGLGPWQ